MVTLWGQKLCFYQQRLIIKRTLWSSWGSHVHPAPTPPSLPRAILHLLMGLLKANSTQRTSTGEELETYGRRRCRQCKDKKIRLVRSGRCPPFLISRKAPWRMKPRMLVGSWFFLCGRWIHLEIHSGAGPELNFGAALWVGQGLGAVHFLHPFRQDTK